MFQPRGPAPPGPAGQMGMPRGPNPQMMQGQRPPVSTNQVSLKYIGLDNKNFSVKL